MKTTIASLISIIVGIVIGFMLSPKQAAPETTKSDSPEEAIDKLDQKNREMVQGRWFCTSSSGWTGVYELLPNGVMKGFPTKGGNVTGSWTIQTSLRLNHPSGGQDNFDLPNADGAIIGVSNAGNKLSMTRED